jgi:hypothetical protein
MKINPGRAGEREGESSMSKRQNIRDYISEHPGCTVTEIADATDIYPVYVGSVVRQLNQRGELFEKENEKGTRSYALAAGSLKKPFVRVGILKIDQHWFICEMGTGINLVLAQSYPFDTREEARKAWKLARSSETLVSAVAKAEAA